MVINNLYCSDDGEFAKIKASTVAPNNTDVAAAGERKNTNMRSI